MKQKKVLHIIKGLGRGGAERLLVSTIRTHGKDYAFDVIYYLPDKSHLVNELRSLGCNVELMPAGNVLKMLLKLPLLISTIRKNQYDILHAHLPWAGILARLAGKITGVPVVYTEHNLFERYNIITRWVSKRTFSWQAIVIAVSHRVEAVLRQQVNPTVPIRVIENGVDVEEFRPANYEIPNPKSQIRNPKSEISPTTVVIGTITALTPQKRIDRWIRIAEQVVNERPDTYFVIVGDGVLREEVKVQAKNLVQKNKLYLAGQSSSPQEWLARFDIFLMSSDFEGLPVSLLEAMSMECAPVAAAVGGIPTVIEPGIHGHLFNPEDESTAVKQLIHLIDTPHHRKEIGKAARHRVITRYSINRMVNELEEVYRQVQRACLPK